MGISISNNSDTQTEEKQNYASDTRIENIACILSKIKELEHSVFRGMKEILKKNIYPCIRVYSRYLSQVENLPEYTNLTRGNAVPISSTLVREISAELHKNSYPLVHEKLSLWIVKHLRRSDKILSSLKEIKNRCRNNFSDFFRVQEHIFRLCYFFPEIMNPVPLDSPDESSQEKNAVYALSIEILRNKNFHDWIDRNKLPFNLGEELHEPESKQVLKKRRNVLNMWSGKKIDQQCISVEELVPLKYVSREIDLTLLISEKSNTTEAEILDINGRLATNFYEYLYYYDLGLLVANIKQKNERIIQDFLDSNQG